MVNSKMCIGVLKDDLMVRLAPEVYEEALEQPGCRAMDFTGRPMKGFVFVDPGGTKSAKQLAYWISLARDFNKRAKASKKKKIKILSNDEDHYFQICSPRAGLPCSHHDLRHGVAFCLVQRIV